MSSDEVCYWADAREGNGLGSDAVSKFMRADMLECVHVDKHVGL